MKNGYVQIITKRPLLALGLEPYGVPITKLLKQKKHIRTTTLLMSLKSANSMLKLRNEQFQNLRF